MFNENAPFSFIAIFLTLACSGVAFWLFVVPWHLPVIGDGLKNLSKWFRTFPSYNRYYVWFRHIKVVRLKENSIRYMKDSNTKQRYSYYIRKGWMSYRYLDINNDDTIDWYEKIKQGRYMKSIQDVGEAFDAYILNTQKTIEVIFIEKVK